MSLFLEVLYDLTLFVREALFGSKKILKKEQPTQKLDLSLEKPSFPPPPPTASIPVVPDIFSTGTSRAYIAEPDAKVFMRPVWAFDTVIAKLPLGKEVGTLSFEGRFVLIETESIRGWVLKDDIATEESKIWPELVSGTIYEASHESTRRIRQITQDSFFAADLFLSLQPQEYVGYRLLQQGRYLPEVADRPRLVGKWHDIYRGKLGVTIGLEPRSGSIIEGLSLTSLPFLGFVTSVHTDQSIVVESVGRHNDGEFLKETLSKQAWFDSQPVFIQF